jgi:phosphoserine phosphatase RsbU/P
MARLSLSAQATPQQLYERCEELAQLNDELYQRNMQIEKELHTTRQLQQSLLPPFIDVPGYYSLARCHYADDQLRISGIYLPCDSVGGDLYDIVQMGSHALGIALADVSGHGVAASFVTALFKASFYRITHNYDAPGDVLFHLNNELTDMITTGDYITAHYCRILDDGNTLAFSSAGHPYPLHYHEGVITPLCENGTPLVWFKDMDYSTSQVSLAPGDKVLAFTDGVTEMQNAQDELFGEQRLTEALSMALDQQDDMPILDSIVTQLSDFTQGHPLADDLSMVLIERAPFKTYD